MFGLNGNAMGIYTRLAGHGAVIAEQNPIAGGNLTGWRRGAQRKIRRGANGARPLREKGARQYMIAVTEGKYDEIQHN